MAAGDLTTLVNLKADWLETESTADDTLLGALITSASQQIRRYLQRNGLGFGAQSRTEVRNGTGTPMMLLREWPVNSVQSVQINGVVIPASSNGSFGWVAETWNGQDDIIPPASVQLQGGNYVGFPPYGMPGAPGVFIRGIKNVTFTYNFGFATLPPSIAMACNMLVASLYNEKDFPRMKNTVMGGQSQGFEMDLTWSIRNILDTYKRVAPIMP